MPYRRRILSVVCLVCALELTLSVRSAPPRRGGLPARLTDADFWTLTETLSEPDGPFRYDNLLSNESGFQKPLPDLLDRHRSGGIYLGVGPEQNFTYIAALEPAMAFILDIRRGNRDLHLLYKALFELSADRAEFVSLLFSRPRPSGVRLDAHSTAAEIFAAYARVQPSEAQYKTTLARVTNVLVGQHGFRLSKDELRGIGHVYSSFYRFGPEITYLSSPNGRAVSGTSYRALMQATDSRNEPQSYLATERRFGIVRDLQARNLIVPVVGDFSGPRALRGIGEWLRTREATVSAFYVSNVEDYLRQDRSWGAFCENVATLPLDDASDFIRADASGTAPSELGRITENIRLCTASAVRPPAGKSLTPQY